MIKWVRSLLWLGTGLPLKAVDVYPGAHLERSQGTGRKVELGSKGGVVHALHGPPCSLGLGLAGAQM